MTLGVVDRGFCRIQTTGARRTGGFAWFHPYKYVPCGSTGGSLRGFAHEVRLYHMFALSRTTYIRPETGRTYLEKVDFLLRLETSVKEDEKGVLEKEGPLEGLKEQGRVVG